MPAPVEFTISGTSPGSPSTAVVGTAVDFSSFLEDVEALEVIATIAGATGGVLDLYLQTSPDGSVWTDWAHFTQLTAGLAAATKRFHATRFQQQATVTAVGQGTTPALAANTVVGGSVSRQMRLLAVAGAGTSLGAAQTVKLLAYGSRKRL